MASEMSSHGDADENGQDQPFPKHWNTFIQIAEFCVMGDQDPKSYGNVFECLVKIAQSLGSPSCQLHSDLADVSRFAASVGFAEKSVALMRQVMAEMGLKYISDLSLIKDVRMACLDLARNIVLNMACHGKEIRPRIAKTGLFSDVLEDLKHMQHLSAAVLWERGVFRSSIDIIQNCCKSAEVVPMAKELNAEEHIKPFLEKRDQNVRPLTLLTLCYIMDDSSSEIFRLDVETVQSFLDRIQANMNKARERQDGFTLEESLFALSRFSSNHFNRRLIVAKGALEMLVFILTTDLVEERELAITAVLELAKDPVNAKFFQRDSQLARVLKDLQRCKHEMTRDKASAALTLIQQQPVDETQDEAESALLEEMMADSSNALDILGVTEVEYLLEQLSVTESTVKRLRGNFAPEQVLRVLANLARGDNRKLEILARGGLDVLQQHLLRGDDDVKLQTVDVLLQLASSTENCAILQSHRGLAEAVKSLRRSDNMAMSRAADTLEHAIKDEKAAKASVVSFNHS
ncbi:hypothetical protein BaRGS_00035993 [Batillaria attramentaria]|uniref:Uncharacterized protein n=1 Tax=Batillaria attramentaria TaxID=370345 RepID=A0ABD0JCZ6_9CAEN